MVSSVKKHHEFNGDVLSSLGKCTCIYLAFLNTMLLHLKYCPSVVCIRNAVSAIVQLFGVRWHLTGIILKCALMDDQTYCLIQVFFYPLFVDLLP
jgi:hypothetical protein